MREITCREITDCVAELYIRANRELPPEVEAALNAARGTEVLGVGREVLGVMCENCRAARGMGIPVCQDTGMVTVFAELGQEAHITGGAFEEAIHAGVAKGCREGYLRASVVRDPLRRENTGDNTPAVIHLRLVPGDRLRLTVVPKGFGSENQSALRMFTPAAGREELIAFVRETALRAGSNPCPPMILGVGIGGTMEKAAELAKHALTVPLGRPHPDPFYAELEREMLRAVNETNVGPQGFGGSTTALGVQIETYPTHIAGLPVAVNVGCYVTRHAEADL